MLPAGVPKDESMAVRRRTPRRLGARAFAAVALGAALVAGCGTPAVVKPVSAPLSGLGRDVQAARNAAAQTSAQAQADAAATGATMP